jgi:hypothetical protein
MRSTSSIDLVRRGIENSSPTAASPFFVYVTERQHLKFAGMASVSRDVGAADAAADNRDAPDPALC